MIPALVASTVPTFETAAIAVYESHMRRVQAIMPGHPDTRSWIQLEPWERHNWRSQAANMINECFGALEAHHPMFEKVG